MSVAFNVLHKVCIAVCKKCFGEIYYLNAVNVFTSHFEGNEFEFAS